MNLNVSAMEEASHKAATGLDDTIAAGTGTDTVDTVHIAQLAQVQSGTKIGRYVVLSKIGAGGMGVVYAAHDPLLNRKVALKLLPSTQLEQEAQALAKVSHPNVVALHDAGEADGFAWLVMSLVEGQTLGSWLASGPREWPSILKVIIEVARGLAAVHAAGITHRDIKPDNILIGPEGQVHIVDFGVAQMNGSQAGDVKGTFAYMSPEQMSGNADERSDQFSLCATLWEALYNERPFRGETLGEIVGAVMRGELRSTPQNCDVPEKLHELCLRGLSTDPSARFPSIESMLHALENVE